MRLMQTVNFGAIEDLEIRHGEPVFSPPPRVVREIKLGGENGPRQELALSKFLLKRPVAEMLDLLTQVGDGTIERLEVQRGVPFRVTIAGNPIGC